jgi:hypothetical protein
VESKKSLKKMFPNLFKELEVSENKVTIDSIRKNPDEIEEETETVVSENKEPVSVSEPDKFRHYNPTVVDFIRRCDTDAQAEEIIAFLHKKGELTEDYACELRTQLKKDGLRSFGPKKEDDYYFKQSGLC